MNAQMAIRLGQAFGTAPQHYLTANDLLSETGAG
jgi:plasmid maintenance system antidote protein VapI